MKFVIPIQATIEAASEAEAKAAAEKIEKGLGNKYIRAFLDGQGVKVLGYAMSKPVLAPGQTVAPPKKP
jgi:hypothetical protein